MWALYHVGIIGNERVSYLAKLTSISDFSEINKINFSDLILNFHKRYCY